MKTGIISSSSFQSLGMRIDPSLHLSNGIKIREDLKKSPYGLTSLSQCSDDIFIGNIFSRNWVATKDFGETYLAASDAILADLETGRYISKRQADKLSYLRVKRDWILVTCSGTLGKIAYTNNNYIDKILTHDLLRVVPNNRTIKRGTVYAFLSSIYGYYQITLSRFGGVVKHINAKQAGDILIPIFPDSLQQQTDDLIASASLLREDASVLLKDAHKMFCEKTGLGHLSTEDYDYFGAHSSNRNVSCYTRNIQDIGTITINAFNHSERIRKSKSSITCTTTPLRKILCNGNTFSTGSFPRIEVKEGHGIMLINQSDIFDSIIKGKYISKRNVKTSNLVEYGEVLIAGVGTLGESETFCRVIFANEDISGQLVSGEFIRMKTIEEVPSGYLFTWLSSDYGFRYLRNVQAGTKLCRPIPKLVLEIPVPLVDIESMKEIDCLVREAHTKRHQANQMELKAIQMIEDEIDKWNN